MRKIIANKVSIDSRWTDKLENLVPPEDRTAQFVNIKICEAVSSIMRTIKDVAGCKAIKILDVNVAVVQDPPYDIYEDSKMVEHEDGTFELVGIGKVIGREDARAGVFVSILAENLEEDTGVV